MMMGGGIIVILSILVILGLLVVGIVVAGIWLYRQNTSSSAGTRTHMQRSPQDEALDILRRRYASGEITKGEYEEMKRDIS